MRKVRHSCGMLSNSHSVGEALFMDVEEFGLLPEPSYIAKLRKLLSKIRRRTAKILLYILPVVALAILAGTFLASAVTENRDLLKDFFLLAGLLWLLLMLAAFEIAYSRLSDHPPDQFGKEVAPILADMREHEDRVYEAREWVVILIIAGITILADFSDIYVPFFGRVNHPGHIYQVVGTHWPIKPTVLFSLLFTTLPVVWFAQGPGKAWAKANPQFVIIWVNRLKVWPLVKLVGAALDTTKLNSPGELAGEVLTKVTEGLGPELRPSDQGFFLALLYRYGFALHDLSISIRIKADGSCVAIQKFVIYLAEYPRNEFVRRLYFGAPYSSVKFDNILGYQSPKVHQKYDQLCSHLQQITAGTLPQGVKIEPSFCKTDCSPDPTRQNGAVFKIESFERWPADDQSFVIVAETFSEWHAGAFETVVDQEDYYEMRFDYPCRSYKLAIVVEENTGRRLANWQPSVTFMGNLHDGETLRLNKARRPTDDAGEPGLFLDLQHPLPGAKYMYRWTVK